MTILKIVAKRKTIIYLFLFVLYWAHLTMSFVLMFCQLDKLYVFICLINFMRKSNGTLITVKIALQENKHNRAIKPNHTWQIIVS